MSCSTTTMRMLPRSSMNSSAVRSVSASVMPATGSSSSSSCGSCISSMPISSHCFWPCDSSPAGRCSCAVQPDQLQDLVDLALLLRAEPRRTAWADPLVRSSSPARGSRTPCAARTPSGSGTCGRCRHARCRTRSSAVRSMVWPKNALPVVGRVLPVMTSIIVVLPAPLGPMMQRSSPTAMSRVSLLSALKPSKRHGDVFQVEDGAVASCRTPSRLRCRAVGCVAASPGSLASALAAVSGTSLMRPPFCRRSLRSQAQHALRQEQRDQDEQQAQRNSHRSGKARGEPALQAVDRRTRR